MVTSHPLLSDVKRKWKMIPYAAGVIVPLALTLLVRNAKKDEKRGRRWRARSYR
ncbi:hypothetical protein YC2023_037343 [Brassica napus]